MNSLNLKQIDGGNIIKQADSGSMFKFELLDENHKKFEEQLGDTATVILKQGTVAVFKKIVAVTDNCVAFNLDKILEVGDYILEIIVGGYVFPSNNRLKISVESTYGDYQPENLVRITYEEIDEKINALTDRLDDLNIAVQTEMMNRIVALEQKEDKDTVYDDTKIKNSIDSLKSTVEQNEVNVNQELLGIGQKQAKMNDRLDALEQKEDKDTVYDDTSIKERISALEDKPDNDTIYDDTNLKAQVSELQEKLKSLNTVRRAPTGYTLDRTTTPWTIWFDNGCGLQFPEFPDSDIVYGYGMDNGSYPTISTTPLAYPLIYRVMSASVGSYTPQIFGFDSDMAFHFWRESATVLNPIRDSTIYDWTNCCGDGECRRKDIKSAVPRVLYELGIWSDSDVKLLGAILK